MAFIAARATREEKREFLLSDLYAASSAVVLGAMMVLIGFFIDDFGGKSAFWFGIASLGFAIIRIMMGISKLATVTRDR